MATEKVQPEAVLGNIYTFENGGAARDVYVNSGGHLFLPSFTIENAVVLGGARRGFEKDVKRRNALNSKATYDLGDPTASMLLGIPIASGRKRNVAHDIELFHQLVDKSLLQMPETDPFVATLGKNASVIDSVQASQSSKYAGIIAIKIPRNKNIKLRDTIQNVPFKITDLFAVSAIRFIF